MVRLLKFHSDNFVIHQEGQIYDFLQSQGLSNYSDQVYFTNNGRVISIQAFSSLQQYATITCNLKLKGGKGGFGAKLKTEGGKKVRPNDNMFSRDISGRRVSYAMAQKEFTEFCKRKNEQDQKVKKERQQFKIFQSTLKEGQSFTKLDKKYNQQLQETEKTLQSSFKIGLQKLKNQKKAYNSLNGNEKHQKIYDKQQQILLNDHFPQKNESEANFNVQNLQNIDKQQMKQAYRKQISMQKDAKRKRPQSLQKQQKKNLDQIMNRREEPIKLVKMDDAVQTKVQSGARSKLKSLFKK